MEGKYIIILILACSSALLLTSLEFSFIKEKTKKILILIIFLCIILSTMFSFFIYKKETIEKRIQQQIENFRFERNVIKMDSITKSLNLQYSKLKSQEKINNKHHNENITNLLELTKGLKKIIDELKMQSSTEQEFFVQNFDSLSNVMQSLVAIAKKIEIENYPLVPILFELKVHLKYKTFPFEKSSMWIKGRNDWQEWFIFYNRADSLDYGNPGFPEFINEEMVMDEFLRNFTLSINIKKDSIMCFTYPMLDGIITKPRNGILYSISNRYDDYKIKIINSNKDNEFILHIAYTINSLDDFKNLCNFQSISDFNKTDFYISYEITNPNLKNIYVQGDVNLIDTVITHSNKKTRRLRGKEFKAELKEVLKDTSFNSEKPITEIYKKEVTTNISYNLHTENVREKFNLDVYDIYLDSVLYISYGKNLSINKRLNLVEKSPPFLEEYSWHCNGRYLFK